MTKQPNKKGTIMAEKQEMAVREKKELTAKEEKTVPGRYFIPYADIYETDDALAVVLEDMEPVYTEYNVGHYARSFALSGTIDQAKIGANLEDGVLTLTLPKAKHAQPRKIAIG
jgi:HSP20 family protein